MTHQSFVEKCGKARALFFISRRYVRNKMINGTEVETSDMTQFSAWGTHWDSTTSKLNPSVLSIEKKKKIWFSGLLFFLLAYLLHRVHLPG